MGFCKRWSLVKPVWEDNYPPFVASKVQCQLHLFSRLPHGVWRRTHRPTRCPISFVFLLDWLRNYIKVKQLLSHKFYTLCFFVQSFLLFFCVKDAWKRHPKELLSQGPRHTDEHNIVSFRSSRLGDFVFNNEAESKADFPSVHSSWSLLNSWSKSGEKQILLSTELNVGSGVFLPLINKEFSFGEGTSAPR